MKKIIFITIFSLCISTIKGQTDNNKIRTLSVKEKAETAYLGIQKNNCQSGCFEEIAFMGSQLRPTLRTVFLKKLPDKVAIEVKKLKNGEYTKPIYVNESCYIIKRIKKRLFRYKLNIIYFDDSGKTHKELPRFD